MTSPRSNEDWVKGLRATGPSQHEALEELRRFLARVLPNALRRHGPAPDHLVEDVIQEALVRVLDHLERFEGRSRFTTWATTIAVRIAMTELRRLRWKDASLDEWVESGPLVRDRDVDSSSDPEHQAARSGILRALREVVDDQLSERQRMAIVAELNGMPQEEIGRHLGLTRNAVYKLTYDARKKLKRGLLESGYEAADIRAAFP